MPIPAFEASGFLPAGVHRCTLDEVRARFGSFQSSDLRPRLFGKLLSFVREARGAGIVRSIILDGSFVTAKPVPNDIDLIIVVSEDIDVGSDLNPAQYNVISRKSVQRRFSFDIVAVREGTSELDDAIAFFQQVRRQPALRKGLLRIEI